MDQHGRPAVTRALFITLAALSLAAIGGCNPGGKSMNTDEMEAFAARYTAAWCSQDPARVAAHFAENGSLKINASPPAVGRASIAASAEGFMSAFPDLVVTMDSLEVDGNRAVYHWTLTGTHTGPGGIGKAVRVSGYEAWTIGKDGLIAQSLGHFDEADYQRQLQAGDLDRMQ